LHDEYGKKMKKNGNYIPEINYRKVVTTQTTRVPLWIRYNDFAFNLFRRET
jgi:hypothetical protein